MIQPRTILNVYDNSGAKTVRCIRVLGGFEKKYASIGDVIVVSVQELRNKHLTSKIKKHDVCRALVIKTVLGVKRPSGFRSHFTENSVILLNKQGNPLGTRIIGTLPRTFKLKKFQKFTGISTGLI